MSKSNKDENATASKKGVEKATRGAKRTTAKKKIRITGGVAFMGLAYNVGQVVQIDKAQADELVETGRAEYLK